MEEIQSIYERDTIIRDLKNNVIEVHFVKADGSTRVMKCTLQQAMLPPNYEPRHLDEQHRREENLNVVVCWDVEAGGWRSFRIDTIKYLEAVNWG